jgi:DNA polymerase
MARAQRTPRTAEPPIEQDTLEDLRNAAKECRACDLWQRATQTVFGEGDDRAPMLLIGEQPGNEEDLAGHPFVGPAGKVLDRALEEAGIDRARTYVTNVVKHFSWEPRGKWRIHKKPNAREIAACRPWVEREIAQVRPRVVVCLGATAAQALLGTRFRVGRDRGRFVAASFAPHVLATVHPSSILRSGDEVSRHLAFDQLVAISASRPRRSTTSRHADRDSAPLGFAASQDARARGASLRRPGATANRARDRDVGQLPTIAHAAQEQPAPAHVATPDEVGREEQPVPEYLLEQVDVLARGDAAQHHDVAVPEAGCQDACVAQERLGVSWLADVERHRGPRGEGVETHEHLREAQALARRHHEHAGGAAGRTGIGARVLELAAEIESAEEAEDPAERNARSGAERACELEAGTRIEQQARALATARCGREQEYPSLDVRRHFGRGQRLPGASVALRDRAAAGPGGGRVRDREVIRAYPRPVPLDGVDTGAPGAHRWAATAVAPRRLRR